MSITTFNSVELNVQSMLEHGLHLGHLSRFWNPKMKEFIFKVRYGVHIINLVKTEHYFKRALSFVEKVVSKGGKIMFVGTKSTARDIVALQADRCQMPYVNHRWLGGMLTNFKTVKQSINRLTKLQELKDQGLFEKLTKKEALMKSREIEKLEKTLGGIKKLNRLPDALFVVDVGFEDIAVKEANKLGIPVIGLIDTNNSPDGIQFPIPANDDAIRAITYSLSLVAQVIEDARAKNQETQKHESQKLARDQQGSKKHSKESSEKSVNTESVKVAHAPVVEADKSAAAISATAVKELREITGAGMMECKKALVEANGDFEKAKEVLEKSSQKKAAKSAARTAAEGVIEVAHQDDFIALIEINCETDFVARDESFQAFRELVKKAATTARATSLEQLMAVEIDGSSVEAHVQQTIAKIGEKIQIRRYIAKTFTAGHVGFYNHTGKMAAIVTIDKNDEKLAKDLAMHIAAMSPAYVSHKDIPQAVIDAQKAIFVEEVAEEEKPADVKEKIVDGRVSKHFSALCLLEQAFIKNPDLTIEALLKQENASVVNFVRFEVGEGIEKQVVDFAAEVMQQARR